MELYVGAGALAIAVLAGLAKFASVFKEEWASGSKLAMGWAWRIFPICVALEVGLFLTEEFGRLRIAAFFVVAGGLLFWTFSALAVAIDGYNRKRETRDGADRPN